MRKNIKENWQDIIDLEDQIREKTGDPQAGFNAGSIFFGERRLLLDCQYRKKKGDDFNSSYQTILVEANYCPFSGKPLFIDEL